MIIMENRSPRREKEANCSLRRLLSMGAALKTKTKLIASLFRSSILYRFYFSGSALERISVKY